MHNDGQGGTKTHQHFRSFCCPKDDPFENCQWPNDPDHFMAKYQSPVSQYANSKEDYCKEIGIFRSKHCLDGRLMVTQAQTTPPNLGLDNGMSVCWLGDGLSLDNTLCCSPPSRLTKDWPVNPAYLWSDAYDDKNDGVTWQWSNNFDNNHKDTTPDNLEVDYGDDPYGFVMLDGPPGSIAKQFGKQFTFLTDEEPKKIDWFVVTNVRETVIDATFDHTNVLPLTAGL
ncbi:hypothetical protein COCCADRAFT_6687 [Bipolaris zeicola 26-R-13]|uniref:Uncharacterized protein n=1 Tax=Cochliobolus carbonum (strain 26-R-13) TaxID=930089 RepID=W6Y1G1_COCC2|nr:uncharacterized protein COCCADRAFT_6687 [Bipolaris zeicola 26-R-13]EUC31440.1 hypothetical protein COCCADRAFT_6687 [Bipolaris zeicola 26-R-13]